MKERATFWVDFKSPAINYKADCTAGTTFKETNTIEGSESHEATEEPAEEPTEAPTGNTDGDFTETASIEEGEATEAPTGGSTALVPGVLAAVATLTLAILLQ